MMVTICDYDWTKDGGSKHSEVPTYLADNEYEY